MSKLLIVDDEQGMRQLLSIVFVREGHEVRVAENGRRALEMLRQDAADLIISDVKMPDIGGIELLRAARELLPEVAVVMMTAFATVDTAREAFKLGADDFITKPFDIDELKLIVAKALERLKLKQEVETLKVEKEALIKEQRERGSLGNIIGHSERMQAVYQMIETVAEVQSTILITGESGTGKELVARAIHDLSPRAERPFVSINCGAFTETLLESELFGYVKGSFTGANTNRKGLFEAANQGTIFLDEIGEMSPAMQVKLLRVLQERKVRPVGAHEELEINTRVIAATNRDLSQMVKEGTFREDLFYRVSVIPIELPPLRERAEDIAELTEHFIKKFCAQANRKLTISEKAQQLLEAYSWPGNVRELEHTIERAVALERADTINPERFPEKITNYNPARIASALDLPEDGINIVAHLEQLEKTYVLEALRRTGGNQTRAAELLRLSVRSLRHLLDKHNIRSLTAQLRDSATRSAAE
ncbi:MAG: two-component system, NtrC family, response regulator PilR [Acidobacteriota bacterium]|jgi:DNA-binding NtrC family response regulator|nr:two-component system, NtrC family, response regulator PilR [Acidobacteriota bacterium]MDT5063377.1 two-component system, NtrC family, response regulator PilR [Acidobacteriota bacterium]